MILLYVYQEIYHLNNNLLKFTVTTEFNQVLRGRHILQGTVGSLGLYTGIKIS